MGEALGSRLFSRSPDTILFVSRHRRENGEDKLRTALINAAIVGLGGFLGALARYGLGGLVHRQLPLSTFPFGTLVVNLLGCFAIGVIAGLAESRQLFGPEFRTFALIGVLGGFTTFSTFGYETFALIRDTEYLRATTNIGLQVIGGLTLVWLGYVLATIEVG